MATSLDATAAETQPPTETRTPSSMITDALKFVKAALGDILEAFPRDIRHSLYAKFCDEYDSPMTTHLEPVLRKRLIDDEVRHMMFSPTPAQYRFYAALLSLRSADGSATERQLWLQVLQKRATTLFYLKHARNWDLVVEFVMLDGLQVLADMFLHQDLQIRGQAIDSFVQITSNPRFDWFNDPVGYHDKVLHSKMIGLAAPSSPFMRNLVQNIQLYDPKHAKQLPGLPDANSNHNVRLPGGTYVMLQVLAFFLSWVRKFYTQPRNELRLSRELLDLLGNWPDRTQSEEPAELELARQVYEDFSRWPPVEESRDPDTLDNSRGLISASGGNTLFGHSVDETDFYFSRELVERMLAKGDRQDDEPEEYKAIELCSEAIAAKMCLLDAHLLRARALVQLLERKTSTKMSNQSTDLHNDVHRCLDDCASVLSIDSANVLAWKYRLRVFAAMELWAEAQELLDEWFPADKGDTERLFLPEDIDFFRAQREAVAEKLRIKLEKDAQQQQLHAKKQAKQEATLLQRDKANESVRTQYMKRMKSNHGNQGNSDSGASSSSTPYATSDAQSQSRNLAKLRTIGTEISSNRGSTRKAVKDPQLKSLYRGHSFVRKFRQVKSDSAALRDLLLNAPLSTLTDAFSVSLGENNFLTVLDVLVYIRSTDDFANIEKATRILRLLLDTARFQFFLEMAPTEVQERVRACENDLLMQPNLDQADFKVTDVDGCSETVVRAQSVEELQSGPACA